MELGPNQVHGFLRKFCTDKELTVDGKFASFPLKNYLLLIGASDFLKENE